MKRLLFILLAVFVFNYSALSQAFGEDVYQQTSNCPTCQSKKMPNLGKNAKDVHSLKLLPGVSIDVEKKDDALPRPFTEHRTKTPAQFNGEYAEDVEESIHGGSPFLEKPIDYSLPDTAAITVRPIEKKVPVSVQEPVKIEEKKTEIIVKPREVREKVVQEVSRPEPEKKVEPQQILPQGRKNQVEDFDVAGVKLGFTPEEVIEIAQENGFEIANVAYGIPSFMVTEFERDCRLSGLHQTRLIHECMRNTAREQNEYYISQLTLKRSLSKEEMVVSFSSFLTDNQAFKIDYVVYGDNSLGSSYKDLLKKTTRRDAFWRYVFDKYGRPIGDNLFWGNPKGIYMQAFITGNAMDGRIVLHDATKAGKDYRSAEKDHKERYEPTSFSF